MVQKVPYHIQPLRMPVNDKKQLVSPGYNDLSCIKGPVEYSNGPSCMMISKDKVMAAWAVLGY